MPVHRTAIEPINDFLAQKRIAIVGFSRDAKSMSAILFHELSHRGYDVVPVNPKLSQVEGRSCYSSVGSVSPAHDEDFEMSRVEGRLVYEVLLELLDPNLVKMQFQMSAMPVAGDPVMYFTKYPGRFVSMHLQGVNLNRSPAEATAGQLVGPVVRGKRSGPQVAVGRDSVDWARVFKAARTGGLKNYFVEQSWDLATQSVAYLKTLNV